VIYGDKANHRIKIDQGWFWKPMPYSVSKLAIALSDFVVLAWVGLVFISSPLWPMLHDASRLAWLRTPYAGPLLISIIVAIYFAAILIRAGPTKISN
jgi:hypothetical protein